MSRTKLKLYASVLALALIGLLVDRFVVGEPSGAAAAQLEVPHQSGAAPAGSPGSDAESVFSELFPENLRRAEHNGPLRDPFLLPADVDQLRSQRRVRDQAHAAGPVVRAGGTLPTMAQFVAAHQLNGVSVVGKSAMAIVDGNLVEVGQTVDHARLLTVEGNKAYFQCLDGVAILKVDRRE